MMDADPTVQVRHERLDINQTQYNFLRGRIAHALWCAYQMGAGQAFNTEPTAAQMLSQMDGMRRWDDDPNMTAEQNHDNWMRYKLKEGWVYGPEKDDRNRTHPDLVPFADLPDIERRKDDMDLFARDFATAIIEDIIAETGVRQWTA